MDRKKKSSRPNPYRLPLLGIAVLAVLMFLQHKHEKLAKILSNTAPPNPAAQWVEKVSDLLTGAPAGGWRHCPAAECGAAFPLGKKISGGRVEFDMDSLPNLPLLDGTLFEIVLGKEALCSPANAHLRLGFRSRRLFFTIQPDGAQGKAVVCDFPANRPPCHLLCEWENGAARIFIDGTLQGEVSGLAPFSDGPFTLFLHHCAAAAAKPKLKNLRVFLLK